VKSLRGLGDKTRSKRTIDRQASEAKRLKSSSSPRNAVANSKKKVHFLRVQFLHLCDLVLGIWVIATHLRHVRGEFARRSPRKEVGVESEGWRVSLAILRDSVDFAAERFSNGRAIEGSA
jgi:hypothetical protein